MTVSPPVIFAGPSLVPDAGREHVAGLGDVEWLPPARAGDLDALLGRAYPPPAIGLVDGVLPHWESPSPREVLRALDHGIAVVGSSGVGALRAVECARYGMVGVGRVFEAYRSGSVEADDAVAVATDPRTGRRVTEPLINFRYALVAAADAGLITNRIADRLLAAAEALHYTERTVPTVLATGDVGLTGTQGTALARFLSERAPDTVRDDAIALLVAVDTFRSPARPAALDQLTEREREVMALVGEGLSNDEIAARLVVSPGWLG